MPPIGRMAEWFKATVLKTVEFDSWCRHQLKTCYLNKITGFCFSLTFTSHLPLIQHVPGAGYCSHYGVCSQQRSVQADRDWRQYLPCRRATSMIFHQLSNQLIHTITHIAEFSQLASCDHHKNANVFFWDHRHISNKSTATAGFLHNAR